MTVNKNTLNGALLTLAELMETNLQAMGVSDADMSNGLMTLADKVLDVEPSVSGLGLDTSMVLTSSEELVNELTSLNLIAVLSASYDDTTQTNVDLNGVLTGATIIFKDGEDNIVGTDITDSDGTATCTVTGITEDTDFQAVFQNSTNFDGCSSNTVSVEYGLVVYYDDCSGNYSNLWGTNPTYTTYAGYPCIYNNKGLGNIPTSASNVMIEFDMYPTGSWGGLDVRDSSSCFVFLRNRGQSVNDHSALISPIVPSAWTSYKLILNNGSVELYQNGSLIGQTTRAVNGQIYFTGGSSSYPYYLKEIRITEL